MNLPKERSWIDKDIKEFCSVLTLKTFWTILHLHLAAVNHSAVTAFIAIICRIQLCLYPGGQADFRLDPMNWGLDKKKQNNNTKLHSKDFEFHQMDSGVDQSLIRTPWNLSTVRFILFNLCVDVKAILPLLKKAGWSQTNTDLTDVKYLCL